jgi:hypothetical protein
MGPERSAFRSPPRRIRRYGFVSFAITLAMSVIWVAAAAQRPAAISCGSRR